MDEAYADEDNVQEIQDVTADEESETADVNVMPKVYSAQKSRRAQVVKRQSPYYTPTSSVKPSASAEINSAGSTSECSKCKGASRFAEMAKVWERKLDELPLEQALGIEKKMSDMLFEAMMTNLQTQKALGTNEGFNN